MGVALLALAVASAAQAGGAWHVIARASTSNGPAGMALVPIVQVRHPHALAMRVVAPPNRRLLGNWAVSCSPSNRTISGEFRWTSSSRPMFRVLRRAMGGPARCVVSAVWAQFTDTNPTGEIRLQLLKR